MTDLKITVLVDNNVAEGWELETEHGLAYWIEVGGCRILFDCGRSDVLCRNAERLNIDPVTADAVVLSHGHYDHTGGLVCMAKRGKLPPMYMHPAALRERYSLNPLSGLHPVGVVSEVRDVLKDCEIIDTSEVQEIGGGFFVTGEIPRREGALVAGKGQFYLNEECTIADLLPDDQAGFIETDAGLVVVLGCCHAGVENTLRRIAEITGINSVHTVIGGMHLKHVSRQAVREVAGVLIEFDVRHIYPLHCTGEAATAILRDELGARVHSCGAGCRIVSDSLNGIAVVNRRAF